MGAPPPLEVGEAMIGSGYATINLRLTDSTVSCSDALGVIIASPMSKGHGPPTSMATQAWAMPPAAATPREGGHAEGA